MAKAVADLRRTGAVLNTEAYIAAIKQHAEVDDVVGTWIKLKDGAVWMMAYIYWVSSDTSDFAIIVKVRTIICHHHYA
jgi:hypothetical protein